MDESTIHSLRHTFQHKIDIHAVWGNKDQIEALKLFFNLDDNEIEDLYQLSCFISNHGLERIVKNAKFN